MRTLDMVLVFWLLLEMCFVNELMLISGSLYFNLCLEVFLSMFITAFFFFFDG